MASIILVSVLRGVKVKHVIFRVQQIYVVKSKISFALPEQTFETGKGKATQEESISLELKFAKSNLCQTVKIGFMLEVVLCHSNSFTFWEEEHHIL